MSDDLEPKINIAFYAVEANIPAVLRLAGIRRVVDNVPPGAQIGGIEKEFVDLFAKHIQDRLFSGVDCIVVMAAGQIGPPDAEAGPDWPGGMDT